MQILIYTQSSQGIVDYSGCVQFGKEATVVRTLNKPSVCTMLLFTETLGLPKPQLLAKVSIVSASGLLLFTGYVSEVLQSSTLGERNAQGVSFVRMTAISDEILLDASQVDTHTMFLGQTPLAAWNGLVTLSAKPLQVNLPQNPTAISRILVKPGAVWSEAAGALAAQTGSTYQCISDTLNITPLGQSVHAVAVDDPGLTFASFPISDVRWLAQDVTICGKEEPAAYVTELLLGDGSTSTFTLTQQAFHPTESQTSSLVDLFQGTTLNERIWHVSDPGAHIALTQSGLSCDGGSGRDGEAIVSSLQQIELGGTLVLEASGVSVSPGSSGMLLGLYTGTILIPDCFAGYQVTSANQSAVLTPHVLGSSVGSSFTMQTGHLYVLRVRIYSPEMERLRQTYTTLASNGPVSLGGDAVASSGQVTFEVQDFTSGAASATTVLFVGNIGALPSACTLGLINSGDLTCSIKTVICSQAGPIHVSVGAEIAEQTPLSLMTSAEGGACHVTTTGTIHFYPGAIPTSNEFIVASYRTRSAAVARQSLVSAPAGSAPPIALNWVGSVVEPAAWSSIDCNNAASAVLKLMAEGLPIVKGSYSFAMVQQDVWPGDFLAIGPQVDGSELNVLVEKVTVMLLPCSPEELMISVEFASAALSSGAFKLSSSVPMDTVLPQVQNQTENALESLQGLIVTGVSSTSVSVNTGVAAPTNGGFEVRRRDFTFGSGVDSDLVLRSSTMGISIPRSLPVEQFYIRMYDASQPPNYSQFSAAVFLNSPFGS